MNQSIGKKGEDIATAYLMKNGYAILERNWRSGRVELDIIAKKDELIVFVEVKTRSSSFFGHPEQAVNQVKEAHILEAAENYIYEKQLKNDIRFDVVAIVKNSKAEEIYHIKDAITPYGLD